MVPVLPPLMFFSGVHQGSVVGPLLFLVYMKDIVNYINKKIQIRLFADDCVLYTKVESVEDQYMLNNALGLVSEWCKKWQMKLNLQKTVAITFTEKKSSLSFEYLFDSSPSPGRLREVSGSNAHSWP